jgi:E3 ubiquitin-protein ligase listerin
MGKGGGKSSASSATRKKHARKAAVAAGIDVSTPGQGQQPKKDKKVKGKKGAPPEPRKKVFIPPAKPAPPRPDPLDALGLQHVLPPELYVVLRRLGKKDAVTKVRALEELQAEWIDRAAGKHTDAGGYVVETLAQVIPVWVSLFYKSILCMIY